MQWSEELSSGLLQAAPDAILVMDEGRIMLVNDRAEELFGWTRADLLGQHADVLLTDETRADFPRILRETLASPEAGLMGTIAVTVRRQDGSEFPAEASLSRVERETRSVCVCVCVCETRIARRCTAARAAPTA